MAYLIHLAILISIYAILAVSLNLIVGYTGLFSMTSAAFYGIGAYATAILMTAYGVNFFYSILVGMAIAGLLALCIGYVLSKFNGDFFALGSLGFNIIIVSVFVNWQNVTKGAMGIAGIDRPSIFGYSFSSNLSFFALVIVFAASVYLVARHIARSAFGRTLKAIREDEKTLQAFGYNTRHYKLAIFVIGSMFAALAGSFFASYLSYIDPSSFAVSESVFVLAMIILGGLASNKGVVLGAVFLVLLPETLRFVGFPSEIAAQTREMVYGLLLVVLVLYRPRGFIGEYKL